MGLQQGLIKSNPVRRLARCSRALGLYICLALGFIAGCSDAGARPRDTLSVVVSIGPQAWLVEQLGADHVTVVTMLRAGDSPATYQPTDAQISSVMASAVYFRVGVPFEQGKWFGAIEKSGRLKIVDCRRGIELRRMKAHHHEHDTADAGRAVHTQADEQGLDPHIWLCPRLLKVQAATITKALIQLDPLHRQDYQARLAELEARLAAPVGSDDAPEIILANL